MALSEIEKALARARGVTEATGAVHEAQMLQLKLWASLLFQRLPLRGGWRVEVDVDEKTVTFRALKKWRPRTAEKKLMVLMEPSVAMVLGPSWRFQVAVDDNLIHVGKQTRTDVNEQRLQRLRGTDQ